jgi:hypothetical protein
MFDQWVLDATMSDPAGDGVFCFCPLEGDPEGEFSVITGMNFASDTPPGPLVGIVHEGGPVAVAQWCHEHKDALDALKERMASQPREGN